MPAFFHFETLIAAVEQKVGHAVSNDAIEVDPSKGPEIVERAIQEVFGDLTTQDYLRIMLTIDEIDSYVVASSGHGSDDTMANTMKSAFFGIVAQRTTELREGIAAISVAAGLPQVADELITLAEHAYENYPGSMWVSQTLAAEARESLDRLVAKAGTVSDVERVLWSSLLLGGLLMSPNDTVSWERHGLEYGQVKDLTDRIKVFQEMAGKEFLLAADILTAVSNRAASELQLKNTPASHPRP
ncbi:hypothetical protein O9X98_10385 [Agrobacterium salinitolerans]|nr:hypothetical protein [Agrobacterium salinitolerans]